MGSIDCVWQGEALLGEGPVWDASRGVLWFVDIKRRRVHRFDPADSAVRSWPAPAPIGWVVPCDDGALLAGLEGGLARFDPEDGAFGAVMQLDLHPAGNRLNDATVAPDGCVWFGSMDDGERRATGRLYRFDGHVVAVTALPPVRITNGPAVSPDGALLYHVDTAAGLIHAVPLDRDGMPGTPLPFVRIHPADGHPDGVTVDSAGNVWVGLWGGWCARLYAPDATLLREVRLPVANVTKVALGGPGLTTAYVTSARIGLDDAALAAQPYAGGLFCFSVEVPGQTMPPARISNDWG